MKKNTTTKKLIIPRVIVRHLDDHHTGSGPDEPTCGCTQTCEKGR